MVRPLPLLIVIVAVVSSCSRYLDRDCYRVAERRVAVRVERSNFEVPQAAGEAADGRLDPLAAAGTGSQRGHERPRDAVAAGPHVEAGFVRGVVAPAQLGTAVVLLRRQIGRRCWNATVDRHRRRAEYRTSGGA